MDQLQMDAAPLSIAFCKFPWHSVEYLSQLVEQRRKTTRGERMNSGILFVIK
jgi:hypothetical protein